MGELLSKQFDGWVEGANTTLQADDLPTNALAHARNTAISNYASGKAVVETRPGLTLCNATPLTSSPQILGMYAYDTTSGTSTTRRLVAVGNDGSLWTSGSDRVFSLVSATAFTAGTLYPSFAIAQNYLFMANGTDVKIYTGSALGTFGITRPTVSTMAGAEGSSGSHSGTYELRVTYGISTTGSESSASDTASATITVTNKAINWSNIPVSSNGLVDRRYLYVRNTSTQANFYRAGTITNNTDTTATTSVADSALVTLCPTTTANNAPPSGAKVLAYHRSRMFTTDGKDLYWSQLGQPMAFDTTLNKANVNPNDGQLIIALAPYNDVLVIFKERSTYLLVGDDPNSWVIRQLTPALGCTSFRSVCSAEDTLYWMSHEGPVSWSGSGIPTVIGKPLIFDTLKTELLSWQHASTAQAVHHARGDRIIWIFNQTRIDANGTTATVNGGILLPYNYRLKRWESDRWDPMRVGAAAVAVDANSVRQVYFGNYAGQIFYLSGANDGVPSGTVTGTFEASGSSLSTISDPTATFLATGGKLIERTVTLVDSTGRFVARRYITANTTTALTLDTAITVTNGADYTYYVGGIGVSIDLPTTDHDRPFLKKRYFYCYLLADAETSSTPVLVELTFDTHEDSTVQSIQTINPYAASDIGSAPKRFRVGRTGRVVRARITCFPTNAHLLLSSVALTAEAWSDRIN